LESLPLNSNGKIDKKALPDPKEMNLTSGTEYVAPRNEIEEQVIKIWEEVLKKDNIGVKDDFFDLGGHSLKAIKVISKIRKQYNIKFEVGHMFEENTVEKIAEFISLLSSNHLDVDSNKENFKI
jgi:acyl carrier protein